MTGMAVKQSWPAHQRGVATLIVALLLLLIVSGLTLFSLSFGMQDRRAATDEVATRLAQEAAQAGLDQGLQFFRAHAREAASSWLALGTSTHQWERCAATDMSLPCGAVAAAVRANYFRHPVALDMRDVFTDASGAPTQQVIATMGGYDVRYDVYALLCLVDTKQPERQCLPAADPAAPENHSATAYRGPYAITLVARSQLVPGSDAGQTVVRRTLAKETIAPRPGSEATLAVVPGSWSDAGRVDARGNYTEI